MKDITPPVPPDNMKKLVQRCLEQAAQINYSQLIEYAHIEGESSQLYFSKVCQFRVGEDMGSQ